MEIGKRYKIIYNDHGFKPVQKIGTLVWEKFPLFRLDTSSEELNINNIIRAVPVDGDY